MEKFEEEFEKQGGDRAQLHNIYKVPFITEAKKIQSEISNEIAHISVQYDNLISSKQNQIKDLQSKLSSISLNGGEVLGQMHEMQSESTEKELTSLLDRKRAAIQEVSKKLERELSNLIDKLEKGALTSLEKARE